MRTPSSLILAVAAAYGYAIGKPAFVGALGREVSRELDAEVQQTLGEMLHAYLRGAPGRGAGSSRPRASPARWRSRAQA